MDHVRLGARHDHLGPDRRTPLRDEHPELHRPVQVDDHRPLAVHLIAAEQHVLAGPATARCQTADRDARAGVVQVVEQPLDGERVRVGDDDR